MQKIKFKKKRAWLIIWKSYSPTKKTPKKKIISIRDSRISSEKIWDFVQFYYASVVLEPDEIAKYSKKNNYGIVIRYGDINNIPCSAIIHCGCGQNPFIEARIVENLIFFEDGTYQFDDVIYNIRKSQKFLRI